MTFTKGLAGENKSNNVIIQCHVPGLVTTKFSGFSKPNILIPTPIESVRSSMRTAGLETITFGHPTHKVQVKLYLFLSLLAL